MTTLPTSEVLNRAADLIEERGWVQGVDGMIADGCSPLCLEGGIAAAIGADMHAGAGPYPPKYFYDDVEECPAWAAVTSYLSLRPYVWNDNEGRTAAEVVEVLRAVALIEAAKENAETREQVSA